MFARFERDPQEQWVASTRPSQRTCSLSTFSVRLESSRGKAELITASEQNSWSFLKVGEPFGRSIENNRGEKSQHEFDGKYNPKWLAEVIHVWKHQVIGGYTRKYTVLHSEKRSGSDYDQSIAKEGWTNEENKYFCLGLIFLFIYLFIHVFIYLFSKSES